MTTDQKRFFRKVFQTYYDAAVELLQSEHAVRALSSFDLEDFESSREGTR